MFRFTLRRKLLVFAVVIAILPLVVAGQSLIRIARYELKSSANDQLVTTARQITGEINSVYSHAWLPPLFLIRNAIDDERLGVQEKISLLTQGIVDLPDLVALQITVKGTGQPLVVSQQDFVSRLEKAGLKASDTLRLPVQDVLNTAQAIDTYRPQIIHIAKTDDWLATLVLPLRNKLAGGDAVLTARVNLARLRGYVKNHPFAKSGSIFIVDAMGRQVFDPAKRDVSKFRIVERAAGLIGSNTRVATVEPYKRPDGKAMLGSFALPNAFDWAVIADKSEEAAYQAVALMINSLLIWTTGGLVIAVLGALTFAVGISRPILAISAVAMKVAQGDFKVRVERVNSRDEIGDLASRFNDMIVQLNERFQLAKFVSDETIHAIQKSDEDGVKLGGDRREVAILFADIRGYTEFSENREPEEVVDVLNEYFQNQADIVSANNGDIDKFVGDQIMAVFQGPNMAGDVVKCALDIQADMVRVGAISKDRNLEIGIGADLGTVIVGAMGSEQRMDYTVLGDHVNTAARLCSAADPRQTLISGNLAERLGEASGYTLKSLDPIELKGKAEPLPVFDILPI